jgi:hypothetical protein
MELKVSSCSKDNVRCHIEHRGKIVVLKAKSMIPQSRLLEKLMATHLLK